MPRQSVLAKKKRGPPATGKGLQIVVRVQPDLLSIIDAWIAKRPEPRPTRAQIIREALLALKERGGF
jgi:hypothetical protein